MQSPLRMQERKSQDSILEILEETGTSEADLEGFSGARGPGPHFSGIKMVDDIGNH